MYVCVYMPLVGRVRGFRMSQIDVGLQMSGTRSWGGWLRAPWCLGADVGRQVGKLGPDMVHGVGCGSSGLASAHWRAGLGPRGRIGVKPMVGLAAEPGGPGVGVSAHWLAGRVLSTDKLEGGSVMCGTLCLVP